MRLLAAALGLAVAAALPNGKAITPPMGFRNWNQWQSNIDQGMMQTMCVRGHAPLASAACQPDTPRHLACRSAAWTRWWTARAL